ncbi:hypothetical protein KW496_19550 [Vibrio fluvialis]|nr:hypothetical protein [Vibrio fluvialis]
MENIHNENQNHEAQNNENVQSQNNVERKPKVKTPRQVSSAALKKIVKALATKSELNSKTSNVDEAKINKQKESITATLNYLKGQKDVAPVDYFNKEIAPQISKFESELAELDKSIADSRSEAQNIEKTITEIDESMPGLVVDWFNGLTEQELDIHFNVIARMKPAELKKLLNGSE